MWPGHPERQSGDGAGGEQAGAGVPGCSLLLASLAWG